MIRRAGAAVAGFSALLLASSAQSSGCCDETPRWSLTSPSFTGYDNSVVAGPANDTRVNLVLLLADRNGAGGLARAPVSPNDESARDDILPFFQWYTFRTRLVAASMPAAGHESVAGGSRCASNDAGTAAFEAALAGDRTVPEADRRALVAARRSVQPDCSGAATAPSAPAVSAAGQPFALYLQGAQAFYGGDFGLAAQRFEALAGTKNDWLRETALYMVARTALNRAQASAFDDYGSLADPGKADQAPIAAAGNAFSAYLRAYPAGRYASSARGLMRRVYWLAGDTKRLGEEYRKLLARGGPDARGIDDFTLAEEIDQKLLSGAPAGASADPVLLAVRDLMRMRSADERYGTDAGDKPITRAEIEAQAGIFASDRPLFDTVRAAHAFYVAKRPAEVLTLIPDAARQPRFTYLQFSRQMLRGFALDAVRDVNARGFWFEMLGGATQPYQRQAVELALALHEERNGGLARVFAPDSKIREPRIRSILLGYTAGPDLLRQQATGRAVAKPERDLALFVLLAKGLGRGLYADFLRDVRLVPASAPQGNLAAADVRGPYYGERLTLPLDRFVAPKGYGDYDCPALQAVAGQLAANPRATKAQICLAEFFRTAGFDHFVLDTPPPPGELGGARSLFPGRPYSRLEVYKAVIADPAAPANDKAYALYRAVRCYAPAGNNDCGGIEVDKAQRRAWFLRLKRDYAQTKWAKSSDLYW